MTVRLFTVRSAQQTVQPLHCTFGETTIMSDGRPPEERITDKIARSFGILSHLPQPFSSSMNLNSSSENYIAKKDAQYVYFNSGT